LKAAQRPSQIGQADYRREVVGVDMGHDQYVEDPDYKTDLAQARMVAVPRRPPSMNPAQHFGAA
jgi:hypothetical protein